MISRGQVAWGNHPPLPHAINKYELRFSNSEHVARYDSLASRKFIKPKYMDVDFVKTVGLWDSISELPGVVGWTEFLSLALLVHERLCWEFWVPLLWIGMPIFRTVLFILNFDSSIRILRPTCPNSNGDLDSFMVGSDCRVWKLQCASFWCEITCEKSVEVCDNHGSHVAYSAGGSKATSICNPTLWYLHQIITNTIFTWCESQSRARFSEVLLIWCILINERLDVGAFILY